MGGLGKKLNWEIGTKRIAMTRKMLIQHNALITARYEMSAAEKNITYMLLSQLGKDDPIE